MISKRLFFLASIIFSIYLYLCLGSPFLKPDYQSNWSRYAIDRFANKDYVSALIGFHKALSVGEDKPQLLLGYVLSKQAINGGIDVEKLNKAIKLAPKDVYPRLLMASIKTRKEAIIYLKKFLKLIGRNKQVENAITSLEAHKK